MKNFHNIINIIIIYTLLFLLIYINTQIDGYYKFDGLSLLAVAYTIYLIITYIDNKRNTK